MHPKASSSKLPREKPVGPWPSSAASLVGWEATPPCHSSIFVVSFKAHPTLPTKPPPEKAAAPSQMVAAAPPAPPGERYQSCDSSSEAGILLADHSGTALWLPCLQNHAKFVRARVLDKGRRRRLHCRLLHWWTERRALLKQVVLHKLGIAPIERWSCDLHSHVHGTGNHNAIQRCLPLLQGELPAIFPPCRGSGRRILRSQKNDTFVGMAPSQKQACARKP